MSDIHNLVASQKSRITHQDEKISELTKAKSFLENENHLLKDIIQKLKSPPPTCGICSGNLALTRRTYRLDDSRRQEMTEHWECKLCLSGA